MEAPQVGVLDRHERPTAEPALPGRARLDHIRRLEIGGGAEDAGRHEARLTRQERIRVRGVRHDQAADPRAVIEEPAHAHPGREPLVEDAEAAPEHRLLRPRGIGQGQPGSDVVAVADLRGPVVACPDHQPQGIAELDLVLRESLGLPRDEGHAGRALAHPVDEWALPGEVLEARELEGASKPGGVRLGEGVAADASSEPDGVRPEDERAHVSKLQARAVAGAIDLRLPTQEGAVHVESGAGGRTALAALADRKRELRVVDVAARDERARGLDHVLGAVAAVITLLGQAEAAHLPVGAGLAGVVVAERGAAQAGAQVGAGQGRGQVVPGGHGNVHGAAQGLGGDDLVRGAAHVLPTQEEGAGAMSAGLLPERTAKIHLQGAAVHILPGPRQGIPCVEGGSAPSEGCAALESAA